MGIGAILYIHSYVYVHRAKRDSPRSLLQHAIRAQPAQPIPHTPRACRYLCAAPAGGDVPFPSPSSFCRPSSSSSSSPSPRGEHPCRTRRLPGRDVSTPPPGIRQQVERGEKSAAQDGQIPLAGEKQPREDGIRRVWSSSSSRPRSAHSRERGSIRRRAGRQAGSRGARLTRAPSPQRLGSALSLAAAAPPVPASESTHDCGGGGGWLCLCLAEGARPLGWAPAFKRRCAQAPPWLHRSTGLRRGGGPADAGEERAASPPRQPSGRGAGRLARAHPRATSAWLRRELPPGLAASAAAAAAAAATTASRLGQAGSRRGNRVRRQVDEAGRRDPGGSPPASATFAESLQEIGSCQALPLPAQRSLTRCCCRDATEALAKRPPPRLLFTGSSRARCLLTADI